MPPAIAQTRAALLLAAFLILTLAACAAAPASTDPVLRFGLVAPFEGRHRQIGYDVIYAARLAVREWNGRGSIGGYRVELVAYDDGGDPELARRAAESLVIDPQVLGVVGHWLEETNQAARPVYREASLAWIEMGETPGRLPAEIPPDFEQRYQEVTPFDESAGPRAYPAYQACNHLIEAIGRAIAAGGEPDRAAVAAALND